MAAVVAKHAQVRRSNAAQIPPFAVAQTVVEQIIFAAIHDAGPDLALFITQPDMAVARKAEQLRRVAFRLQLYEAGFG